MKAPPTSWRQPAESAGDLAGNLQSLRRTLRDVVALSALPSIWMDCDLPRSVQNLTDVLRAALRALTVCVRVELPDGSEFRTTASEGLSNTPVHRWDVGELLDTINCDSTELVEIGNFNGSEALNALPHPLFVEGRQIGCLVACYKSDALPSPGHPLLLQVATNQIALLFQRHKDQEELRRKTNQLAAFLETAAVGLHRVGPDGIILWANDAELNLFGCLAEEYIGHHISEFHADEPVINDILKRLRSGQKLYGYEARVKCKDGSVKEVLIDSSVLWEGGKFVHTQCFTRDMTEQKRAERALAATVRQQRAVADLGLFALRENDLQALFNRAASEISRTLEVEYCKVLELLPEGDAVLLRAGVGWKDGLVGSATVSIGIESQAGYTLLSREPVVVKDLRQETRFNGPPLLHDHGVVSGLSCIIFGEDGPWGVLGAHTKSAREFTVDDVSFLQSVANVLATSIRRRRAEEALRESNALLEGQKDAFQAAMRGCSLEESLQILLRRAIEFTGGQGRAAFYITSRDGTALHHIVGMPEHYAKAVDGFPVSGESMACGLAVHTGRPVITRDIEEDSSWDAFRWLARQHHFRACWSFPVHTPESPALGTLAMYFQEPRQPTSREMEVINVIAHAATVIISRHQQAAEREEAEQQLRETNERLKKVLEIQTVGVMFWDLTTGCLVDANDTFLNMMGYSRAEVQSRSLTWEKFTPPEYHEMSRTEIAKLMASGRVGPYEKEYFRKDGTRLWLLFAGSSLGNNQCVEFCTDITDRKRSEESAARLAAIVEHSDDAIFSTDLDGTITSWNRGAERLYGYTEVEAIGQTLTMLLPEGRANEEPAILHRICSGESVENYETERRRKDGTVIDVSLTVSPVKNAAGKIIGASKVARDITDKVRVKEKLEQTVAERTASLREAVEQMEEFSYSVSHDLRAPLRAMSAYAGVLLEEYGNRLDQTARGYVEKIQRGSDRMNRLTQDVLAYSRVARSLAQPESIDLERLVRDVIHQHTTLQFPAAEIEVVGPLPGVVGHETTLGQSVSNLLNNAVKFVAPGVKPLVRIRAELKGKNVRVWFEDNGIGVKPEHQKRIFNMFERVHPQGKYEGTGIGLTIVRKAMEKMGGKVGVDSDGQHGSRFWIELRRAE
jgi:PAS domain S-box-containing protein